MSLTPERIAELRRVQTSDPTRAFPLPPYELLALLDAYERAERYETALREIEQWALSRPRHGYVIHILDVARNALYPYLASAPQGEAGMPESFPEAKVERPRRCPRCNSAYPSIRRVARRGCVVERCDDSWHDASGQCDCEMRRGALAAYDAVVEGS